MKNVHTKKNTAGERLIEDDCDIGCVSACPTGWQKFDRKCYLWVTDEKRNWTAAENFCQSKESHLASVTSKEIDKFLLGEVRMKEVKVWIGATDQKEEGVWEWSDCSPFHFKDWVAEPDGERKDNCAVLYNTNEHAKGWNDLECHVLLNFVCGTPLCSGINN